MTDREKITRAIVASLELRTDVSERNEEIVEHTLSITALDRRFLFNAAGELLKVQSVGKPNAQGVRRYATLGACMEPLSMEMRRDNLKSFRGGVK